MKNQIRLLLIAATGALVGFVSNGLATAPPPSPGDTCETDGAPDTPTGFNSWTFNGEVEDDGRNENCPSATDCEYTATWTLHWTPGDIDEAQVTAGGEDVDDPIEIPSHIGTAHPELVGYGPCGSGNGGNPATAGIDFKKNGTTVATVGATWSCDVCTAPK